MEQEPDEADWMVQVHERGLGWTPGTVRGERPPRREEGEVCARQPEAGRSLVQGLGATCSL